MKNKDLFRKRLEWREYYKKTPSNVVSEQTKVTELKYILARKDAKIRLLEMENELMRDFLSLTERK